MTDTKTAPPAPPWHTIEDRIHRTMGMPNPNELRRTLVVDYLEAVEVAEAASKAGDEHEHMLMRGQQYGAGRALAQFLVHTGEFTTIDEAADAIKNRRVLGMPKPGTDYSKVVPF
jgi:hypothetical protein